MAGWPVGCSDFSIIEGSWLGARVDALDSFSERLLDIGRCVVGFRSDSPMFALGRRIPGTRSLLQAVRLPETLLVLEVFDQSEYAQRQEEVSKTRRIIK